MTEHWDVWVCNDCYFAHHYGVKTVDRDATDDEVHAWRSGYLRGHPLPNVIAETDDGLTIREWFAGDTDTPADREPLARLDRSTLADNTCSNHEVENLYDDDGGLTLGTTECPHCGHTGWESGITDFSSRPCSGCGSTLGGSRYRLAVFQEAS